MPFFFSSGQLRMSGFRNVALLFFMCNNTIVDNYAFLMKSSIENKWKEMYNTELTFSSVIIMYQLLVFIINSLLFIILI